MNQHTISLAIVIWNILYAQFLSVAPSNIISALWTQTRKDLSLTFENRQTLPVNFFWRFSNLHWRKLMHHSCCILHIIIYTSSAFRSTRNIYPLGLESTPFRTKECVATAPLGFLPSPDKRDKSWCGKYLWIWTIPRDSVQTNGHLHRH